MSYPLSTAEAVLRLEPEDAAVGKGKFLLSTAEAVLRQSELNTNHPSLLYFYCLPLRRY